MMQERKLLAQCSRVYEMGRIWGTNLRVRALQSNSDGSCSAK